ncbi:MAG: DMT family transporter [Gammaproteobacteria bacterium]|nr:DMT family transporter [Gammaproteobacteria bacterium]
MQKNSEQSNGDSLRSNRAGLGISITILGGLCFSIQDSGIKWLSAEIAVVQILFIRSLFGMLFLSASTNLSGERIILRVQRPWLLLTRTSINILSWILFFSGLKYLPLATAVALFFSFPLFLAITSVPILGEKVGIRRTLAIVVGFIGVLFITNPASGIEWPMLLMLGAAFGWALVANATRILGETESTSTLLFHTLLGFALTMLIPQFWIWQSIDSYTLSILAGVAFFGVIAQFCLTKAYAIASPSLIAPFEYTALIWSAIFGYLIWGDFPDIYASIGAGLIVASGLYIIHRETITNRMNTPS